MPKNSKPLRYQWLRAYLVLGLRCNGSVLSAMDDTRPTQTYVITPKSWSNRAMQTRSYDEEHRVDDPSWYEDNGSHEWRQNGVLHRADGPALVHRALGSMSPYYKAWYLRGQHCHTWNVYDDDSGDEFWTFPSTE